MARLPKASREPERDLAELTLPLYARRFCDCDLLSASKRAGTLTFFEPGKNFPTLSLYSLPESRDAAAEAAVPGLSERERELYLAVMSCSFLAVSYI